MAKNPQRAKYLREWRARRKAEGRPVQGNGRGGTHYKTKEEEREYRREWRAKRKAAGNPVPSGEYNPLRSRARHDVKDASNAGLISRPNKCEECGGSGKILAHHDDYTKSLDVRWVCSPCHYKIHCEISGQIGLFSARPALLNNG